MNKLILASTSPYRRALLERLGIPFQCESPLCKEEQYKSKIQNPRELAETLAEAKSTSVPTFIFSRAATIIGGDQVACIKSQILDKPGTHARALEQLTLLSGKTHELITAIVVRKGTKVWRHTDVTRLKMRKLTREQLVRYLKADQPYDCAGSFKLEARGIALFEKIDSADHTAITGLPLIALTRILVQVGFKLP